MLDSPPRVTQIQEFSQSSAPRLLVVVDTEEEFPWEEPHSRSQTSVSAMADVYRGQELFDHYDLKPTYVIDYPVASQEEGFGPLKSIMDAERCVIGAHLHPWVTPPHTEIVKAQNTFPGNLDHDLEKEKLSILTETIALNFPRPRVYKAGRYGVGPNTASILAELAYDIDMSPTPDYSYAESGGPDFTGYPNSPYWFDDDRLCIPCTGAFVGRLREHGSDLYPWLSHPVSNTLKLGGIASRTNLLERIRLSPEGFSLEDMIKVTEHLLGAGVRTFTLSYHSPSLRVGCTPYVTTTVELDRFLRCIEGYLRYFFETLGGVARSPIEIKDELNSART